GAILADRGARMLAQPAPFAFGSLELNLAARRTLDMPAVGVPMRAADREPVVAVQFDATVVAVDRVVDLDTHAFVTSTAPQSRHWRESGPRRQWPQSARCHGASGHDEPSLQMRTWRGVTEFPSANVQPQTSKMPRSRSSMLLAGVPHA